MLTPKTPFERKGRFLRELPDVLLGASIAFTCVGTYWLWVSLS